MPPRRSHKKSRAGCRRCKTRKIKCDEVHPRCGNCLKHGVACDFENPDVLADLQAAAASPSTPGSTAGYNSPVVRNALPPFSFIPHNGSSSAHPLYRAPSAPTMSITTPMNHRLLELKLMHHYTAMTCKTFTFTAPITEDIWKITVPNLAFSGSQHLADAILAVAALHLRSLTPNDKDVVRASHAYMAASLAEYSATLARGINDTNAESLFLTATLIAFQSTASRVFTKDELILGPQGADDEAHRDGLPSDKPRHPSAGCYVIPFAWFHSFQGVKAITAASWQFLRSSSVVTQVINSQAVLQLNFSNGPDTFFGHLLNGLDDELSAMARSRPGGPPPPASTPSNNAPPSPSAPKPPSDDLITSTRQAYQHAVAVLNWAHKIPHKGAPLAFPATVSRRYIELLEERRPRALAILACFFALLKSMDGIWWLQGMARREVLGVVSLFNSDFFGPDAYAEWWPHLEWAMRIALYDHVGAAQGAPIPAEVWGADWYAEEEALGRLQEGGSYFRHIEMLSQMVSGGQSVPPVPE
ncbi:sterol uptake control protein 2 [Podospora conica]|nr:sterol uptake control protein 2 [Schizothecium conicum]